MMYLPPPQPILNKDIRVSGDVEIHPTASLAPGVILQAASNGRIVIGADVCIGMGAIVNAGEGTVKIGDGAILGSGVLIIGECTIGNNSCIGTSTTIFQANVAAMTTIVPGSIVGDTSRQVVLDEVGHENDDLPKTKSDKSHLNGNSASTNRTRNVPEPDAIQNDHRDRDSASAPQVETSVASSVEPKVPVVGQVYINELLVTLFPQKKASNFDSGNLPK